MRDWVGEIENININFMQTLGGIRLRRTIRVWEIRFEKRGPMGTYSSNLNRYMNRHYFEQE